MALTLVSDPHVRTYELTYLVSPEATDADLRAIKEDLAKLVAKYKGEIKSAEEWGKKYLAYSIAHEGKNHQEAVYMHTVIKMPALNAPKVDREVQLDTRVIRHLFVVADTTEKKEKASDTMNAEG